MNIPYENISLTDGIMVTLELILMMEIVMVLYVQFILKGVLKGLMTDILG